MLIDLHAHAPHPDYYDQDPYWGPAFESQPDGDIKLRVGDWILSLGAPERKAALRKAKAEGQALNVQDYMARWRDPKTRLAGMDEIVELEGLRFQVLRADSRRVHSLQIERLSQPKPDSTD